jgi:hypothetical protein
MGPGEKIKVALVCPACGQSGAALVDDDAASGIYSPDHLTPLSDQFYFRMPRPSAGPLEFVCSKCGAILD